MSCGESCRQGRDPGVTLVFLVAPMLMALWTSLLSWDGQSSPFGGRADFVGLGRMVLSYPEMPADVLAGRPLQRKQICRTFSECTTAPRNGMVSGCYPLDPAYKARDEAKRLAAIKQSQSRC